MATVIKENGKMLSGYFLTNIGWEGFVGLFAVTSFLMLGQI